MDSVARLSLNQITTERASLGETVDACARHGVPYVAVWRHKLAEVGLDRAARLVRDAGVRVSSVCRGGMFPAAEKAGWTFVWDTTSVKAGQHRLEAIVTSASRGSLIQLRLPRARTPRTI